MIIRNTQFIADIAESVEVLGVDKGTGCLKRRVPGVVTEGFDDSLQSGVSTGGLFHFRNGHSYRVTGQIIGRVGFARRIGNDENVHKQTVHQGDGGIIGDKPGTVVGHTEETANFMSGGRGTGIIDGRDFLGVWGETIAGEYIPKELDAGFV
ncbi:Hypothetical predicted protein [Paramuricea clavata]|uniref:Uncharacterized protein n=1 Tax=Paramuricea clavata TaxID=317549 RepID=A0A7D9HAK0_PARCT|nr:Hypothetical predicted protein [Paramuricea clavata]